jgi:DNA anti-recombination protein RmuC
MYDNPVLPLPNKAPLIDKILNGDFDYPHYKLQAELVEHELNELAQRCGGNNEMFGEKSSLMRTRRKRLLDDFEKEENDKLKRIFKEFEKNFALSKEQIEEEMLRFVGN